MERRSGDPAASASPEILVALELSKAAWLVAIYDASLDRVSRHHVRGGDSAALIALIERVRRAAAGRAGMPVAVDCVFEAGYDGFWIQRRLAAAGIPCRVMDPASLKVDRRARRVKTDRIDVESLLRALMVWRRGDRQVCRFVRVPGVAEEDARRSHRELARLTKERVGHGNRIKALLALHGIRDYQPLRRDRNAAFKELRTADGQPLPPRLRSELERELARLELVLGHIAAVEAEIVSPQQVDATATMIASLGRLACVGEETAAVLAREVLCRDFHDRRSLAAFTGLTPSPYSSGRLDHDQGISKAGNAIVRARLIQLAWRWVRFQPDSTITRWFNDRTRDQGGRQRRIAIVAVARKLLIALWRLVTLGLLPAGAKLKPAATV